MSDDLQSREEPDNRQDPAENGPRHQAEEESKVVLATLQSPNAWGITPTNIRRVGANRCVCAILDFSTHEPPGLGQDIARALGDSNLSIFKLDSLVSFPGTVGRALQAADPSGAFGNGDWNATITANRRNGKSSESSTSRRYNRIDLKCKKCRVYAGYTDLDDFFAKRQLVIMESVRKSGALLVCLQGGCPKKAGKKRGRSEEEEKEVAINDQGLQGALVRLATTTSR